MVCNWGRAVWKYIRHLDSCDISDNSDSSYNSDSCDISDNSDSSYNSDSKQKKNVCKTKQQFLWAIYNIYNLVNLRPVGHCF